MTNLEMTKREGDLLTDYLRELFLKYVSRIENIGVFSKWNVRVIESSGFSNIDGFLMTCGDRCSITLHNELSRDKKRRGLEYMLSQLYHIPERATRVYLWNVEEEDEDCS